MPYYKHTQGITTVQINHNTQLCAYFKNLDACYILVKKLS